MSAKIIPLPRYQGPRLSPQRQGKLPRAKVLTFARGSQENPKQAAYRLYCEADRLDESPDTVSRAIDLYKQALKLDPRLHIAMTNLGNCYFRQYNPAAARTYYQKAIELNPEQPEALYNLGYLELEAGNAVAAIPLFKRALAADPQFADAWFNLAMALEQTGAPAKLQWQRYLSLEPSKPTWSEIARRHLA